MGDLPGEAEPDLQAETDAEEQPVADLVRVAALDRLPVLVTDGITEWDGDDEEESVA